MPRQHFNFRMEIWFQEELKTYMAIHNIDNKTEAIHRIFKELLDSKKKKDFNSKDFTIGTKVRCLSRNEYFELKELPCVSSNVYCTNEECFQRVKELFAQAKPKPTEISPIKETVIFKSKEWKE